MKIHIPTKEENDAELKKFFGGLQQIKKEREALEANAKPALERLVNVCAYQTGQSYHLRALLFSLWNGKATKLINTLNLEWTLKKDFCTVALAFGSDSFFYTEMSDAFIKAGLFEWFTAQGDEV